MLQAVLSVTLSLHVAHHLQSLCRHPVAWDAPKRHEQSERYRGQTSEGRKPGWVSRALRTVFPPTFWATRRGWQLLT